MEENFKNEYLKEVKNQFDKIQPVRAVGTSNLGLLGVAFIVLKLCGVINWSWLWVLAPFWIGFALIFVLLFLLIALIGVLVMLKRDNKNEATEEISDKFVSTTTDEVTVEVAEAKTENPIVENATNMKKDIPKKTRSRKSKSKKEDGRAIERENSEASK